MDECHKCRGSWLTGYDPYCEHESYEALIPEPRVEGWGVAARKEQCGNNMRLMHFPHEWGWRAEPPDVDHYEVEPESCVIHPTYEGAREGWREGWAKAKMLEAFLTRFPPEPEFYAKIEVARDVQDELFINGVRVVADAPQLLGFADWLPETVDDYHFNMDRTRGGVDRIDLVPPGLEAD